MFGSWAVRLVFYASFLVFLPACGNLPYRSTQSGSSVTKVDSEINYHCDQFRAEGIKPFILCAADIVVGKTEPEQQHLGALRAQFILAMSARLGADRFQGPDAAADATELLLNISNAETAITSLLASATHPSGNYMLPVGRADVIIATLQAALSAIKPVLREDKDNLLSLSPSERLDQAGRILAHLAVDGVYLDSYRDAFRQVAQQPQPDAKAASPAYWRWIDNDLQTHCDKLFKISKLEKPNQISCGKLPTSS